MRKLNRKNKIRQKHRKKENLKNEKIDAVPLGSTKLGQQKIDAEPLGGTFRGQLLRDNLMDAILYRSPLTKTIKSATVSPETLKVCRATGRYTLNSLFTDLPVLGYNLTGKVNNSLTENVAVEERYRVLH